MEDSNKQSVFTQNQIEATRPNVARSFNVLTGSIATSFNAGHEKTIAYREVMAGERIGAEGAHMYIATQTPITPSYQRARMKVKAVFVPHRRVMTEYADFAAQSGGASERKIPTLPNLAGKKFPLITSDDQSEVASFQESMAWRDSWASSYIPRVGIGLIEEAQATNKTPYTIAPPIHVLALRGWKAYWNDRSRNREYQPKVQEYLGNEVSEQEWQSYLFTDTRDTDYYTARARRNNSYYTNYRTELQGFEQEAPTGDDFTAENALINFAQWEHAVSESRAQAENAQKAPWDVMQELRGAPKLTEGIVTVLAEKTFDLNYSAITQNAYNNNDEIEEKFRVMGMQGAYSYTDIDLVFLNGIEIKEDGIIHLIACVTADTVFTSGINRKLLNINWQDRYRPDLKEQKNDVLYSIEMGTPFTYNESNPDLSEAVGFKRKFNEYFCYGNVISGDMDNRGYLTPQWNEQSLTTYDTNYLRSLPNNTYQFFELAAAYEYDQTEEVPITNKRIWLDYSDLMFNKNMAIRQPVYNFYEQQDEGGIIVGGQNQIFMLGETYAITDMPIDEEIKNNFQKFGEW